MGIFTLLFLTCPILAVAFILIKYLQNLNYWKLHNIDTLNFFQIYRKAKKAHVAMVVDDIYRRMCAADKPLAAIETPVFSVVILRDLEAIKAIAITNFDDFPDRGFYVNHRDPISMNIARLDYKLWKPLRQKLNPIFTPAKIKMFFPTLLKVADRFVDILNGQIEAGCKEMEVRDLSVRYTTDVIGNVVIGIECNSLKDPDAEFRVQSDQGFKLLLPLYLDHIGSKYPRLFNLFNIQVYPKKLNQFFTRIVRETVEYRETNNIRRNDFMDILIEMKKQSKTLTLDFIVGQAFAFFVAGSQSSATILSFALFELAINPDIQTKARNNVMEQLKRHDNQFTYESVQDMTYVKQILQETLRKYPVGATMPRICRRACSLPTANGSYHIREGTSMIVPVYSIHHDPLYYPEPDKFRPERFDEAEAAQRPACTYLPFGAGPKACLADRFANVNLTLVLASLLLNFRFGICERTPKALEFDPANMLIFSVKDGIHVKVERVEK